MNIAKTMLPNTVRPSDPNRPECFRSVSQTDNLSQFPRLDKMIDSRPGHTINFTDTCLANFFPKQIQYLDILAVQFRFAK